MALLCKAWRLWRDEQLTHELFLQIFAESCAGPGLGVSRPAAKCKNNHFADEFCVLPHQPPGLLGAQLADNGNTISINQ